MKITVVELNYLYKHIGERHIRHIANVPTEDLAVVALRACGLPVTHETARVLKRVGRNVLISASARPNHARQRVFAVKTGGDLSIVLDWSHYLHATVPAASAA